jgi:3-isopropylmalate/(R)-2-methylmalate dehydratase small subunit
MEAVRTIEGSCFVVDRSDVDTDQIIPKQFLKRIERTGYGEFLFYDWVRNGELQLEAAPVLVAERNFGCGSSREHAVWAIQQAGYAAVIAPSFGDIFYTNATKNGLLPIALPDENVREIMQAGGVSIDLKAQQVAYGGKVVKFDIDPEIKHRLLGGLDDIGITLSEVDDIDSYEASRAWPSPSTASL